MSDPDILELIRRSIAAEPEAISELWWRISEPTLTRLRAAIGVFAAEREASQVRGRVLDALPGYEPAGKPLDVWLDLIVDRYCAERIPG